MLARSLHVTCPVLLHRCSRITSEAMHASTPTWQPPGSASLYPNRQMDRGRRALTSNNMERGLTGSQSWLMDETAGCTLGPTGSWQRCFSFSEWRLPDLNGFDFNGDMPTDASLEAELLTALYWGALCSELISWSTFFFSLFSFSFLSLSAPGFLFCLFYFQRRLGTEEARSQQIFFPKNNSLFRK